MRTDGVLIRIEQAEFERFIVPITGGQFWGGPGFEALHHPEGEVVAELGRIRDELSGTPV